MKTNILITAAGRRVSLIKSFSKELNKKYPEARVYAADMNPNMAAACQVVDGFFETHPANHPNFIQQLLELCETNDIGMVVPTIDTELEVLALNRDKFLEKGINLIISSVDFVKTCDDKAQAYDFFKERGFLVPKIMDRSALSFPLFVKPQQGSNGIDAKHIITLGDLSENIMKGDGLLFMEYLDHNTHDEYTVDLYYSDKGELKCAVPRKRIEVRDGEVSKGLTVKSHLVNDIIDKLGAIKGARGCITAQFFMNKKSGKVYGIEINPRFGGGYPLSYNAGANYPKWLIEEYFEGKDHTYYDTWENNLLMLRYDNEVMKHNYRGE